MNRILLIMAIAVLAGCMPAVTVPEIKVPEFKVPEIPPPGPIQIITYEFDSGTQT